MISLRHRVSLLSAAIVVMTFLLATSCQAKNIIEVDMPTMEEMTDEHDIPGQRGKANVEFDGDLDKMTTLVFKGMSEGVEGQRPLVFKKMQQDETASGIWRGAIVQDNEMGSITLYQDPNGGIAGSLTVGGMSYGLNTMYDGTIQITATLFADFPEEDERFEEEMHEEELYEEESQGLEEGKRLLRGRKTYGDSNEELDNRALQSITCGCSSCTSSVLDRLATDKDGSFSCRARIEWVIANYRYTESQACSFVGDEFPDICGQGCNPDKCSSGGNACGCSTCTSSVLNRLATDQAGSFSCVARIEWVIANLGMNEMEACAFVGEEFPDICGQGCNPNTCSGGGGGGGGSSTIDMLVVVEHLAMCKAAGYSDGRCTSNSSNRAAIERELRIVEDESNDALANAGTDTRLRIVDIHYDNTGFDGNNLSRQDISVIRSLWNPSDGILDYVHGLRDNHRADIVALITDNPNGYCGVAYLPSSTYHPSRGFMVVRPSCFQGGTFTHEFGHNLGCNHDRDQYDSTSGSNYGWSDPNGRFRSVMAYDCDDIPGNQLRSNYCPRSKYFSSSTGLDPVYNLPKGDARHDNVATIRRNAGEIANYK